MRGSRSGSRERLTGHFEWRSDARLRVVYLSAGHEALTGIPGEAILGKAWCEHGPCPGDADASARFRADVAARRPFRDVEVEYADHAGGRRYLSLSGTPMHGRRGRFLGYRGIGRDVTECRRAELALGESEARLRRLLDLTSDWYWEQDEQYRFTYLSPEVDRVMGPGRAAYLLGKTRWEAAGAMLHGGWDEHKAVLDRREAYREFEFALRFPDGTRRWIMTWGEPVFDRAGEFRGYRGVGRDVTARRAAEAALRESETRHRAVVENLAEGLIICDRAGVILVANGAAERLYGVPAARLVGTRVSDFGGERLRPDGSPLPPEECPAAVTLRTGAPVTGFEFGVRRPDGTTRWLSANTRQWSAMNGTDEGGLVVSLRDVSVQRAAVTALRASEARYRAVVDNLAEAVIIRDVGGRVVALNAAARRLFGAARILGATGTAPGWQRLRADGSALPLDEAPSAVTLRTGRPVCDFVMGLRRPDGSVVWVSANSRAILDTATDAVLGVVVSAIDISARRSAERALRESETLSRLVIDNLAEGVVIRDGNLRIVDANESAARILGTTRAALIGAVSTGYVRSYFDEDGNTVAPDDMLSKNVVRSGEPVSGVVIGVERLDGSRIWISCNVRAILEPGTDAPRGVVTSFVDVTAERAATLALKESEERFACAVRGSSDGIWDWDIARERFYISPRLKELLGYRDDELANERRVLFDRLHPADLPLVEAAIDAHFARDEPYDLEVRQRHRDGEYRWFRIRGQAQRDASGRPIRFSGANTDITDRKRAEAQLSYLAQYDILTGLPNRALFLDRLAGAIARARRAGGLLALLFFDLDRFKAINDTLGHQAGDAVLREVAARVKERLRETDTVARLAGDEFTAILEDLARPEDALEVAAQIQSVVAAAPVLHDGHEIYVAASIGVAIFPADAETPEDLLKCADAAMYAAKRDGGQAVQAFSRDELPAVPGRITIEARLRRALERSELFLEYQPQVDIGSDRIVGAEALIRWRDPDLGLVSPLQFIPLAEETGLIVPIGEWVLESACRQAAAWRAAGLPLIRIAVNLSPRQFRDKGLVARIGSLLARTGLEAGQLELEITEGTIMQQTRTTLSLLEQLAGLGVRIAIDDFGTGYSSLAYLKRFPVDQLKIDRAFVRELTSGTDDAAIVTAITTMARALEIRTLAEGVETPAQLAALRELGVHEYQGFLFSRPVAADQIAALAAAG
jgi:diguanylate cyclase (GGDEF)-like protein/PAS domain S-box-containing protein